MRTRGLERSEARGITVVYATSNLPMDPNLTRDDLSDWIDQQIAAKPEDHGELPSATEDTLAQRDAEDEARTTRNRDLAEERSGVIASQSRSWLDRAAPLEDAGPAWDPAALATSLAIGVQTDASGNPILGEDGAPMGVSAIEVWQTIRGLSFDMGRLQMPYPAHRGTSRAAQNPRSTRDLSIRGVEGSVEDQSNRRKSLDAQARRWSRNRTAKFKGDIRSPQKRFLRPTEALALLGSMDEDYITQLQHQMYEAGLYGESLPSWGVADAPTRQAFIMLFTEAAQRDPDKPINRILSELAQDRINRLGPPESGPGSEASQELVEIPDFTPEVTSAETLSGMIDDVATGLFGQRVDDNQRAELIAKLQGKETEAQRKQYDIDVSGIRESASARQQMGAAGAGGGDIDRFMAAISGQESGGNYGAVNEDSGAAGKYQIMPENWGPWATRAGLGPNAPRTPQNQEIVARRIMLDYYAQFGNWRDVAVAWYSGPGRVAELRNSTRAQGKYPSIAKYADTIMDKMGAIPSGEPGGSGLNEVGGRQYAATETFDPAAEAEAILKAQDPIGWQGHEWADRATEFYSLLGGVI